MELFDFNLEGLQDAYKTLLSDNMEEALGMVAQHYEDADKPLDLEPVTEYKSGDLVEFQALPGVSVQASRLQQGTEDYTMVATVVITVWVVAQSPQVLDSLALRYVWAIATVLTSAPLPASVDAILSADIEDLGSEEVQDQNGYVRAASITLRVKLSGNV